jgi:hypothetical protein
VAGKVIRESTVPVLVARQEALKKLADWKAAAPASRR